MQWWGSQVDMLQGCEKHGYRFQMVSDESPSFRTGEIQWFAKNPFRVSIASHRNIGSGTGVGSRWVSNGPKII